MVVVHDDDVAPPRGEQLVVRAEGLWAELVCETAGEHWSFGLEAFGVRFDDEHEAATSDRGERVAVGFDLEWETPDRVIRRDPAWGADASRVRRHRLVQCLTVNRRPSIRRAARAHGRHRARHEVRVDRVVDARGGAPYAVCSVLSKVRSWEPAMRPTIACAPA